MSSEQLTAADFNQERQFAETKFGRIAYVERGTGPAALFFHGYSLNGFQWRGALAQLSSERRSIAFDFMGMGYTETDAAQDLSPHAQAEMVAAFLDALGIESVDIIANDSGGTVAQLFAVRYPARVRTLLLTNCDTHENSPPKDFLPFIENAKAGHAADDWLVPQLADKSVARSEKGCGLFYTNAENFTDESVEYYYAPLVSSPLRKKQFNDYAAAFLPNPLLAIEPELKKSAIPTRIVWGTGDFLFNTSWAEWLDQTLPQSRGIRLVEGANLFFPEEFPEIIAEEARKLWEKS